MRKMEKYYTDFFEMYKGPKGTPFESHLCIRSKNPSMRCSLIEDHSSALPIPVMVADKGVLALRGLYDEPRDRRGLIPSQT